MTIDALALCDQLRGRLSTAAPGLLDEYPTQRYIESLESNERWGLYQHLPDEVRRYCRQIDDRHGREALENYQRLILATLAGSFESRLQAKRLPDSVRTLCREYVERVIARLSKDSGGASGFYLPTNDVFSKQLCVCRLRLLPVGPELVDPLSALPRGVVFRFGVRQFLRAAWFLATRTHGRKPFFTFHTDRTLASEFSPEGYDRAYVRVAELLEMYPEVKGLVGKSWFYDPQLERISPELGYLRIRPVNNGAILLDDSPEESAVKGALRFSKARQEAYEKGEYRPTYHWVLWARRDLIAWARR